MSLPSGFNIEFLNWLREKSEESWRRGKTKDPSTGKMVSMRRWQKNTKWSGGATEAQISRMEKKWAVRFPEDYRLFLKHLFTTDRPVLNLVFKGRQGYLREAPSFYNWLKDTGVIKSAYARLVSGLVFDVESNKLWLKSWGVKPNTRLARKKRVKELVAAAPRLLPVFAHRFLLAEPCRPGNPVFSVWQSDIIVYAPTLRTYLLNELQDITGCDPDKEWRLEYRRRKKFIEAVPFWGELYRHNQLKRG